MDPVFERFNRLIKSMFVDTDSTDFIYDDYSNDSDQDYNDAWEELNDFLSAPGGGKHGPRRPNNSRSAYPMPPEMLKDDYANLKVPFGADFNMVRKSYKELIVRYHPDRNSSTSNTIHRATEKSKDLNISYQRIKAWETAKKG